MITRGFAVLIILGCGLMSAHAQPPMLIRVGDPCLGVSCAGHGSCLVERDEPFCFCDDEYAARSLVCVPADQPSRRLDPDVGQRVVDIASAQADAGPTEVGVGMEIYPGRLGDYLSTGEPWCTDFVSWAYRAAGVPFTGGAEGGWLVGNNFALKRWFERRGQWIQSGTPEWRTVVPEPGDYIRVYRPGRTGHSAIVRRVEGDTLYTVEGNVGNRVRLRTYPNWRGRRGFDGLGRLRPSARVRVNL